MAEGHVHKKTVATRTELVAWKKRWEVFNEESEDVSVDGEGDEEEEVPFVSKWTVRREAAKAGEESEEEVVDTQALLENCLEDLDVEEELDKTRKEMEDLEVEIRGSEDSHLAAVAEWAAVAEDPNLTADPNLVVVAAVAAVAEAEDPNLAVVAEVMAAEADDDEDDGEEVGRRFAFDLITPNPMNETSKHNNKSQVLFCKHSPK